MISPYAVQPNGIAGLTTKIMPILPTHKTTIEYLEHCRVQAADERLVYVKRKEALEQHFAIPYGNTSVLLLGPGTSITQQAARLAASQGMLIGFCAGGATPIYLAALNEYREPEYLQKWYPLWENPVSRLAIAKHWQTVRAELVCKVWLKLDGVEINCREIADNFLARVAAAADTQGVLIAEAWFAKQLYALLSRHFSTQFTRQPKALDLTNQFLDNGNYLAYGLAACSLWILGIPHSLPVLHGKTRRGALVFDLADLVKDAAIMPNAFLAVANKENESQFRRRALATLDEIKALKCLFAELTAACNGDINPTDQPSA